MEDRVQERIDTCQSEVQDELWESTVTWKLRVLRKERSIA